MIRNYHLCHLEIPKTIRQVLETGSILLDNGKLPTASVAAIAKKTLEPGERIQRGSRNFQIRGEAISISEFPNHVPVGLISDVVIRQKVEPGQMLNFNDIEIPDSLAKQAWNYTRNLASA